MSDQLVDQVLPALSVDAPHAAELAAEQGAWLDATRVPMRNVTFSRVTEQQGASGKSLFRSGCWRPHCTPSR